MRSFLRASASSASTLCKQLPILLLAWLSGQIASLRRARKEYSRIVQSLRRSDALSCAFTVHTACKPKY